MLRPALALVLFTVAASVHAEGSHGLQHEYLLHLPAGYTAARKHALVIFLHGGGGRGAAVYEGRTNISMTADKEGFIGVYSQSVAGSDKTTWLAHMNVQPDDLEFLRDLIKHCEASLAVDAKRVFIVGFSSGGLMAERAGVMLGDQLAGIMVVEGALAWSLRDGKKFSEPPKPVAPISVVIVHGTGDKNVAYDGIEGENVLIWSAAKRVDYWVKADRCKTPPVTVKLPGGKTTVQDFKGGANGNEVWFYAITDGGHAWPTPDKGLDANDVLAQFVKRSASTKH
jgi:polyhydroxybutyrate depolymerase